MSDPWVGLNVDGDKIARLPQPYRFVSKLVGEVLKGVDDDGHVVADGGVGSKAQVYPEAIVLRRGGESDPENPPPTNAMRTKFFGEWGFEDDLCGQPAPRLFSTHLYGQHLPARLVSPGFRGRGVRGRRPAATFDSNAETDSPEPLHAVPACET